MFENFFFLSWSLGFTGGAAPEDIEYRIRSRKEGADTFVVHEVPQGSQEFRVEDLQAATTYNFSILAQSAKGASDYTLDIVQYATKAAPAVAAAPPDAAPDPPPTEEEKDGAELLGGIGGAAALLLICNLGLLVCYLRRKGAQEEEITGSGGSSSILEMYLSSVSESFGDGEESETGSEEGSEEEDEDWRQESRRQRRSEVRRHYPGSPETRSRLPPPSTYAPSLAPTHRGQSWQQPGLQPRPWDWPRY